MATGNSSLKTINSWDWDVRVRDRNVRRGVFDTKEVEKQTALLPDLSDQAEMMIFPQPALGGRED